MKKFHLIIILLANISLTLFAQNGYYKSDISSFGNYDMSGKTFYILSGNANISNNDLEFIQYRDIIAQCIIRKHAILTNNQDMADVCILMDYGITDKSNTDTYSRVLFNNSIYSQKIPEFRRVLNLYAYDNQDKTNEPVMLWNTHICSDGFTNDLQEVLPFLMEATVNYIGRSSNVQEVVVQENNIEVYLMKNGYYLNNEAKLFQPFFAEKSNRPIYIHSILREDDITRVNLLAKYSPQQLLTTPKFKKNTYIVYKGEKYPIIAVYLPSETGSWNHLESNISLQPSQIKLIQIVFPIKLEKGDTFDIVSYSTEIQTID